MPDLESYFFPQSDSVTRHSPRREPGVASDVHAEIVVLFGDNPRLPPGAIELQRCRCGRRSIRVSRARLLCFAGNLEVLLC